MSRGPSGTLIEIPAADDPSTRRRNVRPFRFPQLEKIPRSQVALLDQLGWLLPDGLLDGELEEQVRVALRRVFDEDLHLWLDYVHTVAPRDLPRILREPTFLAVLSTSPHRARGLIEVELSLAHAVVDQLLGAGVEAAIVRPLTEIETGVISYVLLEGLSALTSGEPESTRRRTRLEGVAGSLDEGLALFEPESEVAVVELKVLLGAAAGYVRLLLPGSLVATAAPPEQLPERKARRLERIRKNLPRLGGAKAWLRAEIGQVELTGGDLRALRPGDVMLVDSLTTRSDLGEPGRGVVRIGLGRAGRFDAAIELAEGLYCAKLEELLPGEELREPKPDDEAAGALADPDSAWSGAAPKPVKVPGRHDPEMITTPGARSPWDDDEKTNVSKPEESQSQAVELLNDVPLQVVVELARVPVTADEILELHTGQIVELGKGPGEPVSLSINGKVVARGELVEVEGQLGVRIASLSQPE